MAMKPAVVSRSLVLFGAGRWAGAQCLRTLVRLAGAAGMAGVLRTSNRATLETVFAAGVSVRAVLNSSSATAATAAVEMPETIPQNERPRRDPVPTLELAAQRRFDEGRRHLGVLRPGGS